MSLKPSIYPNTTSISHFSRTYSSECTPKTYTPTTDLLIYGATSFTGKLVLAYLATHPQSPEFTFTLAGRTREKLIDLQSFAYAQGWGKPDFKCFGLEDEDVVERAVGECRVVVNLAGPYSSQNAEVLVRQCAKQGRHYVDLTGETPWVKEMIERYDYLAASTSACIVPSCGFDSIPGDLAAYLSAQKLASSSSDAQITRSESYYYAKGGFSGGTVNSAFALMEMDKDRVKRGMGEYALSMRTDGRKDSLGMRPVYYNPPTGLSGVLFIMAPHNTAIVRRSWSLFQNASSILKTSFGTARLPPPIKYGRDFTYDESLVIAKRGKKMSYWTGWVVGLVLAAVGAAFAGSRLVRSLVRRVAPISGAGPSEQVQKDGWMDTVNVSESSAGTVVTTISGQGDPGYRLSARMLAESALSLVLGSDLPPLGRLGGVLTPSTAMGNTLVKRLTKYSEFEFETVTLDEWKAKGQNKKDA